MTVRATLVIGADGSATKNGSSRGVTSHADRENFLAERKRVDAIIIGGNTARSEPYLRTPVPVIALSRSSDNVLHSNPKAHWWNTSPASAIARATKEFGENILIEAGPTMITELISLGLVDQLNLSITSVRGGEDFFDWEKIVGHAISIKEHTHGDTRFITAQFK
ncbi:unannotated protein [freshwater metagenome]|uniref:Unannotated protein n=1 Tax=freshwater metagenome TaxID=449393 RepID=A0A6J7XX80_9ZZZZ|nr:hypothetical protein [Actinomycetota bacterium]